VREEERERLFTIMLFAHYQNILHLLLSHRKTRTSKQEPHELQPKEFLENDPSGAITINFYESIIIARFANQALKVVN